MEKGALFQPPPPYKDADDVFYSHGLAQASHCTPHVAPLDPQALSYSALTDERRLHIRRLYDLLRLMLLRHDYLRASRCLHILMHAYEWRPPELWKIGLQVTLLANTDHTPLRYLKQISRTRPSLRPHVLPLLIRELIYAEDYKGAHEELTSVVSAHPYRRNPQLHTYLGLLTLYLGQDHVVQCSKADTRSKTNGSLGHVPYRTSVPSAASQAPASTLRSARLHFENAVKIGSRCITSQFFPYVHRVQQHALRTAKLQKRAMRHRQRVWTSFRQLGWVFGSDIPVSLSPASEPDTTSPPSPISSETPTLPPSDFFGLDTTFNDSDSDPPTPAMDSISEGPSLPPSAPVSREITPEPSLATEDDPAEELPLDAPTLEMHAARWAVHVAQVYLDQARLCQARLMTNNSFPARTLHAQFHDMHRMPDAHR